MPKVALQTTIGNIVIELDEKATPQTTSNFMDYVRSGFYNGLIFHRVIKGFMIQGGGFKPGMIQQNASKAPIPNEARLGRQNTIGTIAMARTNDPHSATTQFFINVADNAFLDFTKESMQGYGYCAFGSVIEGLDIVKKISQVPTTSRSGHDDVPVEDIQMIEVSEFA